MFWPAPPFDNLLLSERNPSRLDKDRTELLFNNSLHLGPIEGSFLFLNCLLIDTVY